MTLPQESDVLIVGAGPAGLSAATRLAKAGLKVLVLDREPTAGGIPRHCGHYPFGLREFKLLLKGPDYARGLVTRARAAGVQIACNTTVVRALPGPKLQVSRPEGIAELSAKRVILATGTRESSRAERLIGGEKPGGILPTGALQGMVYLEGKRPFLRPVILGTELVSFSALMTCAHAGIRPVAMIEPEDSVSARWPSAIYPKMKGVPLHLSTRILAIEGRERVERVVIEGPSGQQVIETDGVILSGNFRPEATLLFGSHLQRDAKTGGPVIDSYGRCSDPDYFAAGNLLRPVETAGWCWAEGKAVASAILRDLAGELPRETGHKVELKGDALAWALPQVLTAGASPAHRQLQLRVTRPVKGRIEIRSNGLVIGKHQINARRLRRITLPLPAALPAGQGAVEIALVEE